MNLESWFISGLGDDIFFVFLSQAISWQCSSFFPYSGYLFCLSYAGLFFSAHMKTQLSGLVYFLWLKVPAVPGVMFPC